MDGQFTCKINNVYRHTVCKTGMEKNFRPNHALFSIVKQLGVAAICDFETEKPRTNCENAAFGFPISETEIWIMKFFVKRQQAL